jgi:site-specific DNA-methyltransferase (adenine-specific)
MIIDSLKSLAVPIDSLQGLPGNPRRGDVDAVATSLSRFGQRKPIVVRRDDGTIIAGNHTWQAAKKLGWSEIAVAFVGDDDVTAQAYALADNRTAELGDYDDELLKALIDSVGEVDPELLKDTGWSDDAVKELLEKIELANPKVIDEDEVPELPVEAKTKLGDLYHLGRHRLLCGDSTDESNIKKLCGEISMDAVVTDPPYGINANKQTLGNGKKEFHRGNNWDKEKPSIKFLFGLAPIQIIWGGNYFADELEPTNNWLCWYKRIANVSFSEFELAWTNLGKQARLLEHHWSGEQKMHPTMKPLPVMQWCLNFLPKDCNLIDVFAGAGSTLIAAEKTNRNCFAIEYDAIYCDVIIQRWETLTGEKAVLVSNAESTQA